MKKFVSFALGTLLVLTSCVSRSVVEQVEGQRDSLETVVGSKDSLINAVFADMNSISENLAIIKTRENLLTIAGDGERSKRPVDEINNDIAAIDRLLQENRAKIASLQRTAAQLRKANLRIGELEKTIAGLNEQLTVKNKEVAQLKENLSRLGIQVQNLTEQVAQKEVVVETLSGEKTELENQMNTVYYVVGAQKELIDAQILNKQGFIGKTLKVAQGRNLESFTKSDSRLLEEIPVGHKKAQVVTSHPEGSYKLITDEDKVVKTLVITDPERFWESSKILVISYK